MQIDTNLKPADLANSLTRLFDLAAKKSHTLNKSWDPNRGTPVFTINGKYTTRGWTEWTQGFQYGLALLSFDATGDQSLLNLGRQNTVEKMAPHITHTGVHDHGFNNLSTYGNLRRLMLEGRIPHNDWELNFYNLAIKCSGAVQAARWSGIAVTKPSPLSANSPSLGYIYSFNGPHSLFVDTMRTIRILSLSWKLGHVLQHENDRRADLLKRCVLHALATNQYITFHGDSSHAYDVKGRTAHEAVFNRTDGSFRNRATQQGYSPFSTWTRGLAWAILGYAEQLEFFATIPTDQFETSTGLKKHDVLAAFTQAAKDTADHYIQDCAAKDGIPYWDDGAPGLSQIPDWRNKNADPFNDHEPVDSSASTIAAQGLARLGKHLNDTSYTQAALTIARTLLTDTYLSTSPAHEGLLLHTIYHRPNNWDHIPPNKKTPSGESSLWGDYHLLELAVYLQRLIDNDPYLTFFGPT
jgi:unsaturated chondroitin disaccharide hydrolase